MPYFPSILSDPQLGISKKDQNLILGAASSVWLKKKRNLLLYASVVIAWAACIALGKYLINQAGTISGPYQILLWIASFIIFILGSHYLIFHLRFRPNLYQELRNRGHDICPKCGYILIDIPTSTAKCPECGSNRIPLDHTT